MPTKLSLGLEGGKRQTAKRPVHRLAALATPGDVAHEPPGMQTPDGGATAAAGNGAGATGRGATRLKDAKASPVPVVPMGSSEPAGARRGGEGGCDRVGDAVDGVEREEGGGGTGGASAKGGKRACVAGGEHTAETTTGTCGGGEKVAAAVASLAEESGGGGRGVESWEVGGGGGAADTTERICRKEKKEGGREGGRRAFAYRGGFAQQGSTPGRTRVGWDNTRRRAGWDLGVALREALKRHAIECPRAREITRGLQNSDEDGGRGVRKERGE